MTDREKLIDLLESAESAIWWSSSDETFINKIADHLIENGVTFETDTNVGGKWIPVTERLPEKTRVPKDVLVYHKLGNCGIHVDRAWYDSDKNKWRSALSMNMKVTHWMPLPEPPKED